MPVLFKGQYQLKISIPVAFWWQMKKHGQHCLSMDFVMEFIPKPTFTQAQVKKNRKVERRNEFDDPDYEA